MPPVRKNRPKPTISVDFERTQSCPKTSGLAQKLSSMFASEAFIQGKSINLPDKEMTDSEPIRTVQIGPETNTPVELAPVAGTSRKGKEVVREKTTEPAESSARKFAVPTSKGTATTTAMEFPPRAEICDGGRKASNGAN